jgi:hypothetical protein
MKCFLAFAVRFHISNFESVVAGRSHLEEHLVNTKPPSTQSGEVFTKPVVYLLQPCLTRTFYWRVQENNLVLYPDLVYNRLQGHTAFQELMCS